MTIKIVIFALMIYLHIHDDFSKQGILATFKQKDYWKENYPDKMYKNDYKISLFIHAISWTISIMIVPVLYQIYIGKTDIIIYIILFICNVICHAFIYDLKCNKKRINLNIDQSLHILQIISTWVLIMM